MKQFLIGVPEGETPYCEDCPFKKNKDVCDYILTNVICRKYDFTKLHIEEYTEPTC